MLEKGKTLMTKLTKLTEEQAYEMFDEMLNEVYGGQTVAGIEIDPAEALKRIDPIAYRVSFHDYVDSISDEYEVEGY